MHLSCNGDAACESDKKIAKHVNILWCFLRRECEYECKCEYKLVLVPTGVNTNANAIELTEDVDVPYQIGHTTDIIHSHSYVASPIGCKTDPPPIRICMWQTVSKES